MYSRLADKLSTFSRTLATRVFLCPDKLVTSEMMAPSLYEKTDFARNTKAMEKKIRDLEGNWFKLDLQPR